MIKLKVTYKYKGLAKTIKVDGMEVRGVTIALFGNKHTDMIMLSDLIAVTGEFSMSTPSIEELKERNESSSSDCNPSVTVSIDTMTGIDRKVLNEAIYPAIKKAKLEGLKEFSIKIKEPDSIAAVLRDRDYTVATRGDTMLIAWK